MSVRWLVCGVLAASLIAASIRPAAAFCGFYVGKADAGLFNQASQVILVRDGNRTVISMLNDYKGALDEFALVVPVPHVLQREQIHVGDKKLFERVDAYSAPRLAEYHDDDPCMRRQLEMDRQLKAVSPASVAMDQESARRRGLGVTVEASSSARSSPVSPSARMTCPWWLSSPRDGLSLRTNSNFVPNIGAGEERYAPIHIVPPLTPGGAQKVRSG